MLSPPQVREDIGYGEDVSFGVNHTEGEFKNDKWVTSTTQTMLPIVSWVDELASDNENEEMGMDFVISKEQLSSSH